MKVLHVNGFLARKGGVETYLLALLPMLQARGVEAVFAYGTGDPKEFERSVHVPGIERADRRLHGRVRSDLLEVLDREAPDVVHVHNVQNVAALDACMTYGAAVLHTHDHRWVCPASSFFFRRTKEVCTRTCGPACFALTLTRHCVTPRPHYAGYYYARCRWVARNAHRLAHVIAPSADTSERLARAGVGAGRTSVLPYFCPLEPVAVPRVLPARTTITYMGRIAPNKGHEVFVEALGALPPDVRGVMVGSFSGAAESEVRALAARTGCADRLTLRKWASREEVLDVLDATSVLVFPSLWPETMGIVGVEALSRGVPVVASDLGGVREWLRDGENGRLVPPKDAAAIRDAVLEIASDRRRLADFGTRALETVREKFRPERHLDALLDLYARLTVRQAVTV